MSIIGLGHVGITVASIDRSLEFWRDVLGLPLRGRGTVAYEHLNRIIGIGPTQIEWAELDLPDGRMVELFRYAEPVGLPVASRSCDPGAMHVCLEVDGIDELVERMREAAVTMRSDGPVTVPFGEWEGVRCLYVADPDGVTVEFVEHQ